jgi:hypothetical protein
VLGVQVRPEENLGVLLEQHLGGAKANTEVMALGLPGYGPGMYLDLPLYPYHIQPFQPDEVIVLFHLADDFQTVTAPGSQIPYYILDEDGQTRLHPDDFGFRHRLQHIIIRGYEPVNPVRTVASHLFLLQWLSGLDERLATDLPTVPVPVRNSQRNNANHPLGAASFVFHPGASAESQQSYQVAISLLAQFKAHLDAEDVQMRLVTIPYFPPEFYTRYQGAGWDSRLDEYDLFLPEAALQAFAAQNDIPFMPMGAYMQGKGLPVETISTLFFQDGSGHFTPDGHRFFAEAIYTCFYGVEGACPGR